MKKSTTKTKRNPPDATLRNVRGANTRLDEMGRYVVRLSRRITALETRLQHVNTAVLPAVTH